MVLDSPASSACAGGRGDSPDARDLYSDGDFDFVTRCWDAAWVHFPLADIDHQIVAYRKA
jgi:hypothetical protein